MLSWLKNLLAFFFGCLLILGLLCLAELTLQLQNKYLKGQKPSEPMIWHTTTHLSPDETKGFSLEPNTKVRVKATKGDVLYYDYLVESDKFGRRKTGIDPKSPLRHGLLFGASYTFGVGVDNDQSYPSYLQRLMPSYRIYNYAMGGTGPQHMLRILETRDLKDQVSEEEGLIIYHWAGQYVDRAVGGPISIAWTQGHSYYELDQFGVPEFKGTFKNGRPLTTRLYLLFDQLLLTRALSLSSFFQVDKDDAKVFCAIVHQSKQLSKKLFPNSRFIAALLPFVDDNVTSVRDLAEYDCLRRKGIDVISLLDSFKGHSYEDYTLKHDSHANPTGNKLIADQMYRGLVKRSWVNTH